MQPHCWVPPFILLDSNRNALRPSLYLILCVFTLDVGHGMLVIFSPQRFSRATRSCCSIKRNQLSLSLSNDHKRVGLTGRQATDRPDRQIGRIKSTFWRRHGVNSVVWRKNPPHPTGWKKIITNTNASLAASLLVGWGRISLLFFAAAVVRVWWQPLAPFCWLVTGRKASKV